MSRSGRRSGPAALGRSPLVAVAGEDQHDRDLLTELLAAMLPGAPKIVPVRGNVALKDATGANLSSRVSKLVQIANGFAAREQRPLGGLVVHFDLDDFVGPHYELVRKRVAEELQQRADCSTAVALAAWETEGWLLLFPDAFPRVHRGWKVPRQLRGKDHGQTRDAKEVLQRQLGSPRYREADSVALIRAAVSGGEAPFHPQGGNRSYRDFLDDVATW